MLRAQPLHLTSSHSNPFMKTSIIQEVGFENKNGRRYLTATALEIESVHGPQTRSTRHGFWW